LLTQEIASVHSNRASFFNSKEAGHGETSRDKQRYGITWVNKVLVGHSRNTKEEKRKTKEYPPSF